MWISWKIEVPESGYYKIAIKARQNFVRGLSVHRKLYIDGKVPFKEAEDVEFPYSIRWYMKTIGQKGKPYLVYLTKGVHEIKLEATLGSFTEILSRVENTAIGLNELYRKIIMITGTSPDLYRDYFLEEQIPGLVKTLLKFSNELEEEATLFEKLAGQKGGEAEFTTSCSSAEKHG